MKKVLKKSLAIFISALMAFAVPVAAYASANSVMSLTANKDDLYAGVTYEITATVNNVTSAELITASSGSAFTWSTDIPGTTIISTNNYS